METLRIKAYLFVLSAWMVCGGSAQPNDVWNDGGYAATSSTIPFQPQIAATIIVLTTMCALTIILLLYARHRRLARIRRRRVGGARGVQGIPGRVWTGLSADILSRNDPGLERSVIDALPIFKFGSLQGMKEGLECAVCLSSFEGSEVLRLLPKCQHAFHVGCVDRWLESNSTCPLCRQKVEAEDVFMVYRHEDVEEANRLDDRTPQLLQAFVERENVDSVGRESESSRFAVPGSLRQPGLSEAVGSIGCFDSGRKEALLQLSEADEELNFARRFAHRIIVSDVMSQHRWSDIKHSDLLFLSSQMITTDSGRMAFVNIKPTDEIETESRPTTETPESDGYSAEISRKRSMSEIIGIDRLQSRSRNNNTLLPITRFGEPNEQKWFSIAGKTVQWFAGTGGGSGADKFLHRISYPEFGNLAFRQQS